MATTIKKTVKKQSEKILDAVSTFKPQTVIEEIGALQNSLQNTLAGLSAQISIKLEQMKNVEEAIAIKESELKELYEINAEAISLEEMREKCLKEESDWNKRAVDRQNQWNEDAKDRLKKWNREEEDYLYSMEQKKKRFSEEHNVEVLTNRRLEKTRQEDLEKQWSTRESEIASREKEFSDLKTQVTGFDERLKADIARAEAIAVNRIKKEHEHEVSMLKKDIESERILNVAKNSALDDVINNLQSQIEDLNKQLVIARTDAKEITSAALQSASGRQAMEALQRVTDGGPSPTKK